MSVEAFIKRKQSKLIHESANLNEINKQKTKFMSGVKKKIIESYSNSKAEDIAEFGEIKKSAKKLIEQEKRSSNIYIDAHDEADILDLLIQAMFGYGILDPLIKDEDITEIMVNGLEEIFIERKGQITRALDEEGNRLRFNNKDELMHIIEKIVAPVNRKVDDSNPIVDARLPNGNRVNIVLNPISLDGSVITIRKFPKDPYTMSDLIQKGTITKEAAAFLKAAVMSRHNIIISGGTGSGKTTFLNALSNYIPSRMRIITIEDSAELTLINRENIIRLETRPPNIEGKGEISMRKLLKTALRMRPDVIVVGEVRGGEAIDMLQAMNTGHDGSLTTGHANSAGDMLKRLETMVLMSGIDLPLMSIRQQITSAIDYIVHVSKLPDGSRKVVEIVEMADLENMEYRLNHIFKIRANTSNAYNELTYTGNQLTHYNKFRFSGINLNQCSSLLENEEV